jgi:replicative DNA helicase
VAKKPDHIPGQGALDAEKTIIGMLVAYPGSRSKILPHLTVDDIQISKHRKVFQVIVELSAKGIDADRIVIWDTLSRTSGNDVTLSDLVSFEEGIPEIPFPESYIRILKDCRSLRKLHVIAQDLGLKIDSQLAPLDIIQDIQGQLLEVERGSLVLDNVPALGEVIDSLGGALEIINPTTTDVFIPTGFTKWDSMTGGLEAGKLAIIAGRPSSGKTSLAMCMAQNIAEEGVPVVMFSLEMSHRGLLDRMVCVKSQLDFAKYRGRRLNENEKEDARYALAKLYEIPLYIDDKPFHSIGDISRKLDRLAHKQGVRVCFLDYVQLLTSGLRQKSDRRNTTEILGEAVEGLKSLGKRLGIAMVLLSQMNRESERRGGAHRPMLSDLKDSGSLEQAADLVCFTFREFQYKSDQEHLRDYCEVIISKARDGKTGVVPMRFFGNMGGRFEDV